MLPMMLMLFQRHSLDCGLTGPGGSVSVTVVLPRVLPYTLTLYPFFCSHYHTLPHLHHVETCTIRVH